MDILWFIINNILTNANILIGIIVAIGLIIQKKSADKVVIGTMKAVMGLLILGTGAAVMCGPINYLSPMLMHAFNLSGVVPMTTSVVAIATAGYGSTVAYIIVGAFLINLILARFTPLKYIFLAGHHFLYEACALTIAMAAAGLTGLPAVILGSCVAGFLYAVLPAINNTRMMEITEGQPLAMGHFGATGYWLAGQVGKLFGNHKDEDTESIEFGKNLGFLKETTVAVALVMTILLAVVTVACGGDFLANELGVTESPVTFVIIQGLTFGAGLTVMLLGVRMMISEILSAFEGISSKVVPDAKPALDCPVVFPFAPNAVLIGFLSATIAGTLFSILWGAVTSTYVVPPIIEFFFMGGTGAVFGNKTGGWRGAIIGGAINGILFIILPYFFYMANLSILGPSMVTVVDTDFCLSGIIVRFIAELIASL